MEKIIEKIMAAPQNKRRDLMMDFIVAFLIEAAYPGNFYWAMDDEKEALKRFGHHEIGWFNGKTQQFVMEHPDAQQLLVQRIKWASDNKDKIRLEFKYAEFNRQLICVEMKLKTEYYTPEDNFYLKVGMIPDWSKDYKRIVGYCDKPVVDFHC